MTSFSKWFERRVLMSKSMRAEFYRSVELEMSAGGNLEDALSSLADEEEGIIGKFRATVWHRIKANVENGDGLYKAVGDIFPADERLFMRSTEQIRDKADAYKKMADRLEEASRSSSAFFISLAPGMMSVATAFVLAYIVGGILDRQLATMVMEVELGAVAEFTRWFSQQQVGMIFVIASIPFLLIGLLFWSFPNWTGTGRRLVENTSLYKYYRETVGAELLTNLAQMHEAGISFTAALSALKDDATPYIRRTIVIALPSIAEGEGLGKALQRSGTAIPDRKILSHLSKIEKSAEFATKLNNLVSRRVAQIQLENEAKLRIYSYVAMAIGMGLVALAFWPVFSLVDIGSIGASSHLY